MVVPQEDSPEPPAAVRGAGSERHAWMTVTPTDTRGHVKCFYDGTTLTGTIVVYSAGTRVCVECLFLRTRGPAPGGDHFDLRQPCLLMIEVGRRVITSPTTETGEQPSLSSGWSDAPSLTAGHVISK